VVVLDTVLTVVIWTVMLAPAFLIGRALPGAASVAGLVLAALFAANLRSAVLRPLFLTMVMVKFHTLVQNQPIHLEWHERLTAASGKFVELEQKAAAWMQPRHPRQVAGAAQPA
jgi:hypothetical protein